jgi:hypothetical protein
MKSTSIGSLAALGSAARCVPILLMLAGCPEEAPPTPPDEQPIPLDALCAEVAKADCARLEACGALYRPFDLNLCQLRQSQILCAPAAAALRGAVGSGSLTYFELAARECRDAVADLPCSVGLQHGLLELPECRGMVQGMGGEGAECHLGLACAEGFYCSARDGCPGRCLAYKQNNETCRAGDLCAPDLFCSVTGMRCRARVDLGGACELTLDNNPCRDGGWCESSNPASTRCVPVRGRGQGCNSTFECIVGARCIDNRCSAGEEGDVCNEGGDCRLGLACHMGACVEPLALSTPCATATPPCAEGLVCTSSAGIEACHPQPVAGNRCGAAGCYLSRCQGGTCIPHVLPQERCATGDECFPGHACEDDLCRVEPIACNE